MEGTSLCIVSNIHTRGGEVGVCKLDFRFVLYCTACQQLEAWPASIYGHLREQSQKSSWDQLVPQGLWGLLVPQGPLDWHIFHNLAVGWLEELKLTLTKLGYANLFELSLAKSILTAIMCSNSNN